MNYTAKSFHRPPSKKENSKKSVKKNNTTIKVNETNKILGDPKPIVEKDKRLKIQSKKGIKKSLLSTKNDSK